MIRSILLDVVAFASCCLAHGGGDDGHGYGGHRYDNAWSLKHFKSLVTFGNSYTDEARLSYFIRNNGSAPPVGWEQPVSNSTSTGGYIWPRYVSWYTGANTHNVRIPDIVAKSHRFTAHFRRQKMGPENRSNASGHDELEVKCAEIPFEHTQACDAFGRSMIVAYLASSSLFLVIVDKFSDPMHLH